MSEVSHLDLALRLLQPACTLGSPIVTLLIYQHSQKKETQKPKDNQPKEPIGRYMNHLVWIVPLVLGIGNIIFLVRDVSSKAPLTAFRVMNIAIDVGLLFLGLSISFTSLLVSRLLNVTWSILQLQGKQIELLRYISEPEEEGVDNAP